MLDKSEVHKNAFAELNTELVKKKHTTWPPPYPKGGMDDFKQAHNIFSVNWYPDWPVFIKCPQVACKSILSYSEEINTA